jgi:hypothetical protein
MSLELEKNTESAAWTGVYDVVNIAQTDLSDELSDLRGIGAAPLRIGAMDFGVDFMVDQLIQKVKRSGTIDLLRIHGHGVPGLQTVSSGMILEKKSLPFLRSIISSYNFVHIRKCLAGLQGLFAPNAQVWLMGCNVGASFQGSLLVNNLAKLWRVPVKAGFLEQFGGFGTTTFGLEGPTITGQP